MRNIAFVIWMVGFPISETFSAYVNEYLLQKVYSTNTNLITSILVMIIWIFIAVLLYERKQK